MDRLVTTLVAVLVAAAPAVVAQDGETLGARFAAADSERQMLAVFRDGSRGGPEQHAAAITALGAASRRLEDGGSSHAVTKALASGADEDDVSLRRASVLELMWGRDPDIAIDVLDEVLDETYNEIQKRLTRPDAESRAERRDETQLYALACRALAYHRDDRAVDALADQLRRVRPSGPGANIGALLLPPLSEALLDLGQRDGVELVVRKTSEYVGVNQRGNAKRLHDALSVFADAVGYAPPAFDDRYDQAWREWFAEHEDGLVEEFGRLDEPIARPAELRGRRERMEEREPTGPRRP